ncbi:hypothetical protein HDU67_002075, partial [Dinochytrium kinnereticum]
WMDSESFDTTIEIIQRCPFVLVLVTSRPREEYREDMRRFFDKISEMPFGLRIDLGKLTKDHTERIVVRAMKESFEDIQSVAQNLLRELHEKSQGNPMVIKLLCKLLSNDSDVSVDLGVLHRRHAPGSMQESLPIDASTAVVSQLDRLDQALKVVLRAASVAGQFFNLEELRYVLRRLYPDSPDLCTNDSLNHILSDCIKRGFLSDQDAYQDKLEQTYSFDHYLIYQGIYQSQLPVRRNEIHAVFADYYESIMTPQTQGRYLSTLLYHLLKLNGQEKRKQKHVRDAFAFYGERHRPVEGMPYYEILKELECIESIERTPFQAAQELRYLGQLVVETGPTQSYIKSLEVIKSNFKIAFAEINVREVVKLLERKTVVPYLPEDTTNVMTTIQGICFEIWQLLRTVTFLVFNEGKLGSEMGVIQCLQFLLQTLMINGALSMKAAGNAAMILMADIIGKKALADMLMKRCLELVSKMSESTGVIEDADPFPIIASIYDARGEWGECGIWTTKYISRMEKLGIISVSKLHVHLLVLSAVNEL